MVLTFGGGASEIGASFLMLQLDGKNIALDCGIRMGEDSLPDFQIIDRYGSVDCIVLSHAHMDHSGALPVLSREYPNARIYMTHATKDLARILLYDSLNIMEHRESEIPIYAEAHVRKMLDNIVCFSPNHAFRPFAASDSDIEITFYGAGHIAGAVGVFVSGEEGSFFYSGDFSATPQRAVEGASFPKLRPDVAVFESTYGDRLHASRDIEEERLIAKIASATAAGGKLLIPAFSLGRSQEIILMVNRAINKKQLPGSLKVYVDGMVNDICRAFLQHPNYLRTQYGKRILKGIDVFYNENVIPVNRDKELRERIVASGEGLVVISSSGMLTGGPSQWYAEKLAGDERNAIALTGYQDEESPGRQLMDLIAAAGAGAGAGVGAGLGAKADAGVGADAGAKADVGAGVGASAGADAGAGAGGEGAVPEEARVLKLGGKSIPVRCDIGVYGLSAHADKMEILALAHALSAKRVFFCHGQESVVESLGAQFQKEYNGRVYIPKNGERFELAIRNKRKQAPDAARAALERMPPPSLTVPQGVLEPQGLPVPQGWPMPQGLTGLPKLQAARNGDGAGEVASAAEMAGVGEVAGAAETAGASAVETIERLWRFVLDRYGVGKALTLEDLYYICYGKRQDPSPESADPEDGEAFGHFRGLVNKEAFFEAEKKRPFMFHAVAEEELRAPDGAMEVNAMLGLVDAYFPPATGLYKKGARFEEKKALLYFNFPSAAAKALAEDIEAFEQETGWTAEVNAECNLSAAEQLINDLMGGQSDHKVSYFRTEGMFQAVVGAIPANADQICESFGQMSGLELRIVAKGGTPRPPQADIAAGQMEQNQAFSLIDLHFSGKPHKVYKKGIRLKDGEPGIELSFITPNAGSLYEDDIRWLAEQTRWNIWVSKASNQHELLKAARELLAARDIVARKLSFVPERACVIATCDNAACDGGASPTAAAGGIGASPGSSAADGRGASPGSSAADGGGASPGSSAADGGGGATAWERINEEFFELTGAQLLLKQ